MTDSQHRPTEVSAAWTMHILTRRDGPPVRFKGREISHAGCREGDAPFVTIWARRKGGFVVAYSTLEDGELIADSQVVATYDEAADLLERRAEAADLGDLTDAAQTMPLAAFAAALHYQQMFDQAVGAVLATWDEQMRLSAA